jgi:ADP-heptose:LPS heptosyltransferase
MAIKILIISTNAIGDTYISLSALEIINRYDTAKIDFVTSIEAKILFEPLQGLNVFLFSKKDPFSYLSVLLRIRKTEYDYVLNFFPGRINTIFTILAKGKTKAGYFNFKKIRDWYRNPQIVKIIGNKKNREIWMPYMTYLQRIQLVLNVVGIKTVIDSKYIYKGILNEKNNLIVIHPFSKFSDRLLSPETITALINELRNTFDNKIVIIGKFDELSRLNEIMTKVDNVEFYCKEKIEDLIELITNSFLFIGVDSFPLHIADSFNSDFIGIFGPTDPHSVLINSNKSIKLYADSLSNYSTEIIIMLLKNKIYIK